MDLQKIIGRKSEYIKSDIRTDLSTIKRSPGYKGNWKRQLVAIYRLCVRDDYSKYTHFIHYVNGMIMGDEALKRILNIAAPGYLLSKYDTNLEPLAEIIHMYISNTDNCIENTMKMIDNIDNSIDNEELFELFTDVINAGVDDYVETTNESKEIFIPFLNSMVNESIGNVADIMPIHVLGVFTEYKHAAEMINDFYNSNQDNYSEFLVSFEEELLKAFKNMCMTPLALTDENKIDTSGIHSPDEIVFRMMTTTCTIFTNNILDTNCLTKGGINVLHPGYLRTIDNILEVCELDTDDENTLTIINRITGYIKKNRENGFMLDEKIIMEFYLLLKEISEK